MTNRRTFQNPLLPGFYPDPSICRVGSDYYMVTSSFVYYPGLPIFHSKDLVHWEQIGHGIHRPDQLDYKNCETSLGLWAPTIRYHEGTFYIINTFVSEGREARRDNYIITAADPAGPWSDPVFIEHADGIDSSIFFDEDGSIWYAGNFIQSTPLYEGHHGIYLNRLDPDTFQFTGNRTIIWDGAKTRSKWIEAPHIYKKDGWYYLMVAEGGTFDNHSVMIARCKTIDGDYEICPRNPIVSHRHMPLTSPVSVVGHGDLFETQNHEWWMVLLGVRPYTCRSKDKPFYHNLGRETFLVPMIWDQDGWPRIDNPDGIVHEQERLPDLTEHIYPLINPMDSFDSPILSMQWNTIHPPLEPFYSLTENPGCLRLYLKPQTMEEICTPAFIGRRQQHTSFQASASLSFTPSSPAEEAGISLVQDDRYHYHFLLCKTKTQIVLRLVEVRNSAVRILKEMPANAVPLYLTVRGSQSHYDFYYGTTPDQYILFYEGADASLLSSTVNEGFTGTYIGMYATSNHTNSSNYADFKWFSYVPSDN